VRMKEMYFHRHIAPLHYVGSKQFLSQLSVVERFTSAQKVVRNQSECLLHCFSSSF
jgi:hypothetical protein